MHPPSLVIAPGSGYDPLYDPLYHRSMGYGNVLPGTARRGYFGPAFRTAAVAPVIVATTPYSYPSYTASAPLISTPFSKRCAVAAIIAGIVALVAAIALIVFACYTFNHYALSAGIILGVGGFISLLIGSVRHCQQQ